jgi:hypothetical protein
VRPFTEKPIELLPPLLMLSEIGGPSQSVRV